MPKVPEWMRENFRRGLAHHEAGRSGSGMMPRTVADARRAVNEGTLPSTKPVRMAAWFARHMSNLDNAPKRGDKDYPSPGQVAHMLWGGGATKSVSERAQRWAEREVARQERESAIMVSMRDVFDEEPDNENDAEDEESSDEDDDETETSSNPKNFGLPERAVIVVAVEGELTADGRMVDAGALSWRTPPLSLTVNHDPNQRAGRIDDLMRVPNLENVTLETFKKKDDKDKDKPGYGDGSIIVGSVTFNLDTEFGRQVAGEVRDGFLTGVSMEVGDEVVEYGSDDVMHLVEGKIGAVTLAPFQAIESARVVQVASINVWEGPADVNAIPALVASSAPDVPPAAWFTNPELDVPTGLTVTDDGKVYGHLALWDTCHTGRPDVCLLAPSSSANYAFFTTGYVQADDNGVVKEIPVGCITMQTGHASTKPGVSAAAAVAHYENTGNAVADIVVGEDEHGIWFSGALRPHLSAADVRELRGSSLSGDWRTIQNNLELVAALAVNVPGFPVPRVQAGLTAAGTQTALVAAGVFDEDCGDPAQYLADVANRLLRIESAFRILQLDEQAAESLSARMTN